MMKFIKPTIFFLLLLLSIGCKTSTSNEDLLYFDFSNQKEFIYDIVITGEEITGTYPDNETLHMDTDYFNRTVTWIVNKEGQNIVITQTEGTDSLSKEILKTNAKFNRQDRNHVSNTFLPALPKSGNLSLPLFFKEKLLSQTIESEGNHKIYFQKNENNTSYFIGEYKNENQNKHRFFSGSTSFEYDHSVNAISQAIINSKEKAIYHMVDKDHPFELNTEMTITLRK